MFVFLNYANKGDYNTGTALHMWAYSSGVDDVVVVLVIDSAAAGGQHVVGELLGAVEDQLHVLDASHVSLARLCPQRMIEYCS